MYSPKTEADHLEMYPKILDAYINKNKYEKKKKIIYKPVQV